MRGANIMFRILVLGFRRLRVVASFSPTMGDPVEHARQFPVDVRSQVTASLGDLTLHRIVGFHDNGQEHVLCK